MPTFLDRVKSGWNAFVNNKDPSIVRYGEYSNFSRPDRLRLTRGNERTIVTAVYNRIAMDVAAINLKHVRTDENDRFLEEMDSSLNNALNLEANVDQTGKALIQDAVLSMFDEGCVAIVPTDTSTSPYNTDSYNILELRTGKILEWYPSYVKVRVYNERKGIKEDIFLNKKDVSIIENPFYAIMNERNSIAQKLIHKLNVMDVIDEQLSSGKLNIIMQLPYTVKTPTKKEYAEQRIKDIEVQLKDSKYGIAYMDATEHITQLNRPLENNLMEQVEYLTKMLYSQLCITEEIMNGTADETTMLNYYNRTIEPILTAFADEMKRKFLTKTARSQHQSIAYFRNPFGLVPINNIAEMADKFTRNEILSTNEVRGLIGFKPSDNPKADELINKNMPQSDTGMPMDYAVNQNAENEEAYTPQERDTTIEGMNEKTY